jgi:membrane protease YdiL (CAAX protease family)
MPAASGFQIAVLIFAFHFLALFATRMATELLSLPFESYDYMDRFTTFGLAVLALVAVGPLRRYCLSELRRPIAPGSSREVALVALAATAIPFAIAGAIVLGAFAAGEPGTLPSRLLNVDPAQGWDETLSPALVIRTVAVSWIVAPIVEELVFRGLLYRAWERQWGWIPSTFLTSACFSLFHPNNLISAFLTSIVLIGVLRRTGTLRAAILVHMAFNILVSWPFLGHVLLTIEGRDINRMSTWSVELASLVFVAIALPAYLAMSRQDVREAAIR